MGQVFVDALQSQVGGRSAAVYSVDYAASGDFANGIAVANTVVDRIRNETNDRSHRAELSQHPDGAGRLLPGAVVTGFATSADVPAGFPGVVLPTPMPPGIADHVAAVALFGEPSAQFLQLYGAPPIDIGPRYAPRTIALCAQGDTICDGTPNGMAAFAHISYSVNGMVGQAAVFAAIASNNWSPADGYSARCNPPPYL